MTDRLSNIELLRMIAMCLIIGLQYFSMGDANRKLCIIKFRGNN